MKKINIEGLEGKTLEFAQAFNTACDKIAEMEAKKVDFSPLEKEIEEVKKLAGNSEYKTEIKALEDALISRINEIEAKSNKTDNKKSESVVDGILGVFESLELKSLQDLKSKKSQLEEGIEFKANITSASVTGNVSRTQEVSMPKFVPIRPLAFIPNVRKGNVTGGKSILMWTPSSYTNNTGYAGEGNNTITENTATATEKYRKMAKISAKQYITAETFEDLPQFAQRLTDQLNSNAELFLDNEILSGDGNDSTAPNHIYGIIGQGSTTFDAVSAEKVEKPNVTDLCDAVATQIEIANYVADTVFMHPSLANKLRRTKTTTGEYVVNMLITGEEVMGGLRVIRTTGIDANAILVCNAALIQLWIKRNLTIKIGQFSATDVENDRFTAILFLRAQILVEDDEKKGVVYVDDVAAALEAIKVVVA